MESDAASTHSSKLSKCLAAVSCPEIETIKAGVRKEFQVKLASKGRVGSVVVLPSVTGMRSIY